MAYILHLLVYVALCDLAVGHCENENWICHSGCSKSSGCASGCNWRGLLVDGKMHRIPDSQIKSSSFYAARHEAISGRLFNTEGIGAWVAAGADSSPWIEFDLGKPWVILAVVTRGRHLDFSQWVTSYKVKYASTVWDFNSGNWRYVLNRPAPELTSDDQTIFLANHDMQTMHVNWLAEPIKAQFIRIFPQTHNKDRAMRADLIGCFDHV